MSAYEMVIFAFMALLPIFVSGDTCLSPDVKYVTYTTSDAAVSLKTVFVVGFSVDCKNGLKDVNLYAELNGLAVPASRIANSNKYQASFSDEHKALPAGDYTVRVFDEEGYSTFRKAGRSGEDVKSIKSLFTVPVSHDGASQGIMVQSEFVAVVTSVIVWYIAHTTRNNLQSH